MAANPDPVLTWDLATDVRQLFEFPFMVNAFRAGTIVAVVAGLIGWFMVLRRQTFAGHTLAVVGFPGAAGAVLLGYSSTVGFFAFCLAAALVIAALPHQHGRPLSEESAVTGTVQAFALACGYLFVSLYKGNLNGISALLFGSFLGITEGQVLLLSAVAVVAVAALAVVARPLFFASIDADVAAARGLPVRTLSTGFLVLLGVAAAETSQITGSLLVFALLVLPAATAQAVTTRPAVSVLVTVAVGVGVTWAGLGIAYYSAYPIGFWVTSLAFAAYLLAPRPLGDPVAAQPARREGLRMIIGGVLVADLGDLVAQPFLRNAFIAGTAVAIAAGLVGYFVVLRSQVFTGDALSHVAFTSALAALAFGVDVRLGLLAGTVVAALLLGTLGPRGRADDVVIGSVLAWVLGLGVLFLSIFTTNQSTGQGSAGVNVLFGSIFGLSGAQTALTVVGAAVVVAVALVIARPLLFASIDEAVAAARGVPVRAVSLLFLVLVGVTAAQATQAVGALLLLGLLAAPAGAAQRLTTRPYRAMFLSAAIAVASVWIGLGVSYAVPKVPPSFAMIAVVTVAYGAALAGPTRRAPHPLPGELSTRSSGV